MKRHIPFILIVLASALLTLLIWTPIACQAQWRVIYKNGKAIGAMSAWTEPEIGYGQKLALMVPTNCKASVAAQEKSLDLRNIGTRLGPLTRLTIETEVNGNPDGWDGITDSGDRAIMFEDELVPIVLRVAETVRMVIPTRSYGDRVYSFNMRNSQNSIDSICP